MNRRVLIGVIIAAVVGALLLPGRFSIDIHFGLEDVVQAVGMVAIMFGVFYTVTTYKVGKREGDDDR